MIRPPSWFSSTGHAIQDCLTTIAISMHLTLRLIILTFLRRQCSETIVSLTSYPARIGKVHLVIISMLSQNVKPRAIILWLSSDQFPQGTRGLPRLLRRLVGHGGFRIEWLEGDIGSYKKLLPALEHYPDSNVITIDDDAIYPRNLVKQLEAISKRFPGVLVGTRGKAMTFSENTVDKYLSWPPPRGGVPSKNVFLTGVGGILYPPHSLNDMVLDASLALKLCPSADDVWFKVMSVLAGASSVVTSDSPADYWTIPGTQSNSLTEANVLTGRNDEQMRDVLNFFGTDLFVRDSI
jgi:hypothetical protein